MALTPGTRLGVYEITAQIGEGGMGEVYRATDTRLKRQVAIKILPPSVAADADRLARFQREAEVLASLNHPNIAAIHGLDESMGMTALVLELVDGEDLSQRITRGAIPIDEALPIARQIADALEVAHEQGIVHRDLKPANIKVRADGTVKVLDFGLAKALEPGAASPSLSMSPTIATPAMTQAGMILGTAPYMSPEQARGKTVDKRADVWAYGCVFYEMLAGKRAFEGDDVRETFVTILRDEPDWSRLPSATPRSIRTLLRRCLQKDPQKRLAYIGIAKLEIDEPSEEDPTSAAAYVAPPRWWRTALTALVTAAVVGGLTAIGLWTMRPATPAAPISRFLITLPAEQQFANNGRPVIALSPDGARMAYVANQRLYLRSMSDLQTGPIAGSDTLGGGLAFSPDSQSIAFVDFAPGQPLTLKTISVNGGAAVTVSAIDPVYGISWGSDGVVLGQGSRGIVRVSPNGGKPETLVAVKGDELAHGPQVLPGGEFVLFTLAKGVAFDRWDRAQVVVQSLKTGERTTLIEGGTDARYVPTGHIVYALGGVLLAIPFDLRSLKVTGGSVPIVEGVSRAQRNSTGLETRPLPPGSDPSGTAHFSFSHTGTLVYIPGPATSVQSRIVLVDRTGALEPLSITPGPYEFPRLSPDGKRMVVGTYDGKDAIVWLYELSGTSTIRRLTFGGRNRFGIWSSDGQRVAFQSDREGDFGVFSQRADGGGPAERLTKADEGTFHVPESWSPQGDRLLVSVVKKGNALWTLSTKDKKLTAFGDVRSEIPTDAVFSPDGRWVAYQSGSAADHSIYVEPFPSTGAKYQVAKDVHHPLWSRDGKELFYVPRGGEPVVASVTAAPSFSVTAPTQLPRLGRAEEEDLPRNYDVTLDGTRLLRVMDSGQSQSGKLSAPEIQVVLNWTEELKARVPTK